MSRRGQVCYIVFFLILGFVGMALAGGSVHEAIRYDITGATGIFLGLRLAKL